MKQQLRDYGTILGPTPIHCDKQSALAMTQNPILHSRTKHIDIRYHFLRGHVQKKDMSMHFIGTDKQLPDIFTKALDEQRFLTLRSELGMVDLNAQIIKHHNF